MFVKIIKLESLSSRSRHSKDTIEPLLPIPSRLMAQAQAVGYYWRLLRDHSFQNTREKTILYYI